MRPFVHGKRKYGTVHRPAKQYKGKRTPPPCDKKIPVPQKPRNG